MMRPQAGRAVGPPARRQRRRVERVDCGRRRGAQADMGAVALENREHLGPMIEPELAVTLAEGHRLGPDLELGIADPRQHRLVEARRGVKIAHRDGDVVDHGTRVPVLAMKREWRAANSERDDDYSLFAAPPSP